jgi:coenzyme F420-0:L-glutamate ligase/coenzyme F420-1:gamma-L-glutamate ligase
VVRADHGVLIVETASGWVCANAGIDASNVPGDEVVGLLPEDPDRSARRIRAEIAAACGARPAVLILDSFGRPWRLGQTEVAIGCAGLVALDDWRGRPDTQGRPLAATSVAVADQLAGAADLVRDKLSGAPVVLIAGAGRWRTDADGPGAAAALQRGADEDLFR